MELIHIEAGPVSHYYLKKQWIVIIFAVELLMFVVTFDFQQSSWRLTEHFDLCIT